MMIHERMSQPGLVSRRAFCWSAGATVTIPWAASLLRGAHARRVKFFKNLGPGHIGVRANQRQLLDYAAKHGFEGMTPHDGEFANASAAQIREWVATMKDKGICYGAAGLPVEFRRDEQRFKVDLAALPKRAEVLHQLGVTRMATWVLPGHNELTYLQHFKMLEQRFRQLATVLEDYGIRLGLEFVGPRTSRARFRYPFVCAQRDMMELVDAVGTKNVGLLLDSWHWYTSHGTIEELMELSNEDIVHVHVNDAPAGIAVDEPVDMRRKLPVTTGVIDLKGFVNALVRIGYDGPIECEPFDQELCQMAADDALEATIASLNRLWGLIDV